MNKQEVMNILLKYPTRGRPAQFLTTLSGWLKAASDPSRLSVMVNYDLDDALMTNDVLSKALDLHPECRACGGQNKTKIEACNANLDGYPHPWDVLLLLSDDMFVCHSGWDTIIEQHILRNFPGRDGALWFHDGAQTKINTLECVTRKRYEHFGYVYHPSYASVFADNENTEVGLRDGKLVFIPQPICIHEHPAWGGHMPQDDLYRRNDRYWHLDQATYERRKAQGFPL